MILESVSNPVNLNIKDLTIESPKPPEKPLFDPFYLNKLIEKTTKELISFRLGNNWSNYLYNATKLKVILGDECPDLELNEFAYEQIVIDLFQFHRDKDWKVLYPLLADLFILMPEKRADFEAKNKINHHLLDDLPSFPTLARDYDYHDLKLAAKLIFPDREIEITNSVGPSPEDSLVRRIQNSRVSQNWRHFTSDMVLLRLLYPQSFTQIDPITKAEWREIQHPTEDLLLGYMADIKILTAKEARITVNGLEILMGEPKPDFLEKPLELPVRRMF